MSTQARKSKRPKRAPSYWQEVRWKDDNPLRSRVRPRVVVLSDIPGLPVLAVFPLAKGHAVEKAEALIARLASGKADPRRVAKELA